MAPTGSRKRIKPSPSGPQSQSSPSLSNEVTSSPVGAKRSTSQKQGSGNWYPALWPAVSKASKAAPVTEVARESISVAQNVASSMTTSSESLLHIPKQHRNPPLQLTKKKGASTRSLPADATTTKINIASDGSASTPTLDSQFDTASPAPNLAQKEGSSEEATGATDDRNGEQLKQTTDTFPSGSGAGAVEPGQAQSSSKPASGWFSWFYTANSAEESSTSAQSERAPGTESTPTEPSAEDQTPKNCEPPSNDPVRSAETPSAPATEAPTSSQKRTWFQMLYGSSAPPQGADTLKPEEHQDHSQPESLGPSSAVSAPVHDPKHTISSSNQPPAESQRTGGPVDTQAKNTKSGWSFWFRDSSHNSNQVALADPQSIEASTAQRSSSNQPQDSLQEETGLEQKAEDTKKGNIKIKTPRSSAAATDRIPSHVQDLPPESPPPRVSEAAATKQLQKVLPNQVLPLFSDTFAVKETPSLVQTIGRFLHYRREPDNKHVYLIRDPPSIKNALAIGVHGYFPAPLIRTVLGQPTGTSVRFATMAAEAIHKWTESHGYACDVEKIALEGEGRIAERVDLLWKLLLNWVEKIRKADFILVACHSQGVPVAIMLVAKLIAFGCLNATRVGVCAMAGVNMGPFSDYRSRWISGSAGELFEFALPYSQVSKDYEAALKCALDSGVRISYIGSIDDQLVSLESSLFSPVVHPYIYRAVFVDGRVHAPSFLSHLVGFVLKLRNLGISDHGLIRELSSPLAGSLYTGEGHSRLYDEEAVYRLAIEFALETSNVSNATLDVRRSLPSPSNPYILPFAMRGILEEEYVRRELYEETMQLLRQYDDWKPSSKVLKDVKFRLEGIRSKL
ncbi:uncharacterized protein YML020W [Aspergillus lentulus]|uniref:Uncharacterized protein YML020W n=1 Tax=Aspergillus lentulus TaxID=293939 RepID=A0AAN5YYA9_ASPLE|nr:uncharacterized protein YML020W [Aspergillus lentulus]KAF4152928.1 hypothetical protein CNMCM6069_001477 [Aspergillus lentulus]KAF4162993.1 hypothetical protein CNMCM6936_001364 [Aspergillus lentulus]KAF4172640.1 hypothetical protein CNMCM8060_001281 [Aspergillus lentulus]KAF4188351.1 hypothetical protein CNMCM7927_002024 [Aspergillus lentulus]KAF4196709.1 hypothetical protein CNMCM8694_004431 [Aspergillus lentulus]